MSIDRQKVIDTAQKFAAKGQFDKAIVEYMRIVKEDPADVRVLLKIGDLQVRKGSKDDAIATYSRVAGGYDQQGFFLKAIAVYKQILSIDPNLTDLYAKLADLYVKLGLIPDALAHLDALASRFARAGQEEKVVGVLRQMVQVDPTSVPVHIKLAELLSKLGKGADAATEFEAGCHLLREAGRIDDWAKVGERLLFHRPSDAELAKQLAAHYIARQDAKRALPKLQVCFKANARDVETLELLAAAFRELGQLPKTISVLKEIARIHHEGGQHEKRNELYRRVLELAPNDTESKDALRGSSRLARRPSAPPGNNAEVPKPSVPPAPKKPSIPHVAAISEPPEVIDDAVEEIVVEDADEEAVYDLKPSKPPAAARQASHPPSASAPLPRPRTITDPRTSSRAVDPAAELVRLIGEADIFLKYGLKQKAVGHLVSALELDRGSIDVLARLRDVYADLGDAASSSRCSVQIAEVVSAEDPQAALAEVTHALQLDPSNSAAADLYNRLSLPDPPGYGDPQELEPDPYGQTMYQSHPGVEPSAEEPVAHVVPMPTQAPVMAGRDIEEGLDEAEFFVTQGLYDEARDTLQQLLAAHPNHPLVIERFEELEAMVQAQAMPADDQSFALAERLAEEVSSVEQSGDPHFNAGGEMIDVETVFAQFKRGVEKSVSPDDADTHYDLGIAYKEMGLIDDAISEFKISAQSQRKTCLAETMIGLCFFERNDVGTAIDHFKRALQTSGKNDREEMALYFELGNAYEAVGDLSEAMYFFQKVEKRDPAFRGVRQRVERLAAHVNSGTRQQPAQNEMDEVDRAFDELLKG